MALQKISVSRLWKVVTQDLAAKNQGGHIDADTFNRALFNAVSMLMEYYIQKYEQVRKIPEALVPFIVPVSLPIASGHVEFPSDWRHSISVSYQKIVNESCEASQSSIPMDYLTSAEELWTVVSSIRGPSLDGGGSIIR